jgi:hypothetical protein
MSQYRMTFVVEVDDEQLAEHSVDEGPSPNDPEEWIASDLVAALQDGYALINDAPEVERL